MNMYFIYWDLNISIILRIWVDGILCPDYSIHTSRSLLILSIMIYLRNLTDYIWHLPSNYPCYHNCWDNIIYSNNTLMLCLLHILLYWYLFTDIVYPVIPVSWLHMLMSLPWLSPNYPSDLGNLYIK